MERDRVIYLCILVYLVIYDSGQVSLERLLLSWYPSQSESIVLGNACNTCLNSVSVGFNPFSKVDIPGSWYTPVNFRAEKRPGEPELARKIKLVWER